MCEEVVWSYHLQHISFLSVRCLPQIDWRPRAQDQQGIGRAFGKLIADWTCRLTLTRSSKTIKGNRLCYRWLLHTACSLGSIARIMAFRIRPALTFNITLTSITCCMSEEAIGSTSSRIPVSLPAFRVMLAAESTLLFRTKLLLRISSQRSIHSDWSDALAANLTTYWARIPWRVEGRINVLIASK